MSVTVARRTATTLLRDALPFWWLAAALFTAVAGGALWRAYGPSAERSYVSSVNLYVVAVPSPADTTSYGIAVANDHAVAVARAIAQGSIFRDAAFDAHVIAQLASASPGSGYPSTADVANALTATHEGTLVTVTARWSSPAATALARAAMQALQQSDLATHSAPMPGAGPSQIVIQPGSAASPATLDPAAEAGRLRDLVVRLVGGVLIGTAAALAAGWVTRFRTHAENPPA